MAEFEIRIKGNWKKISGFIIAPILIALFIYNLDSLVPAEQEITQHEQLFLDLQQKYSRDFPGNGYSLNFEYKEPNHFIVVVDYHADSKDSALDVMNAGREFVLSIGERKYGLNNIVVTTRATEVEKEE